MHGQVGLERPSLMMLCTVGARSVMMLCSRLIEAVVRPIRFPGVDVHGQLDNEAQRCTVAVC